METVKVLPPEAMGREFIPAEYLPPGEDEYYLRNLQNRTPRERWRKLRAEELELLVKNGNSADSWEDIRVTEEFDPTQIVNCSFHGLVRIGAVQNVILEHHDLQLPVGITNSKIVACDIGDLVAIHNVRYLAHYIIGDRSIITNIDEMHTTNHAKFGNGILKDGEPEEVRITLDLVNESGSRAVCPFDGMIPADAYLWSRYRDDRVLQKRFLELTQARFDSRRGYYGTTGEQTVLKNSRIIKDVKIGPHCYIKGANKLKNLTINSTAEEPTQIGEGVELVNGIIGQGCRVFYGCKAVRFIMGNNASLKYGARLIHSYLGDNSTVSCCELLNNLIFPAHEQHHNNSFLVAALVMGQSNIAAGATIGSNHNSRANDNEIQAGRGFWPGLCTSLKHSSRFASFVLIAKGSYPAELDIPFPFALVSQNQAENRLEVLPAFWWLYNMYALARNSWKFGARDKRLVKAQHIEFDALAPDTVEEILRAKLLLEEWVGAALAETEASGDGESGGETSTAVDPAELARRGRQLLQRERDETAGLIIRGPALEKSRREAVVLRPYRGYAAYLEMLHHYAATNLITYLERHPEVRYQQMCANLSGERTTDWENLGGQLVPGREVDRLREDVASGAISSWDDLHRRYDELWDDYPLEKQRHAYAVFTLLAGERTPSVEFWHRFIDRALKIQELRRDRVYESRKKDYENPFRHATYRNEEEMVAAMGTIEENSFINRIREETEELRLRVAAIKGRG